jgi:hypothetical protein
MAKLAHITPIRASSLTSTKGPHSNELLDAYSSWLFFERHFLHIGRFGIEAAVGLIDTVQVDNAGALFHLPANAELPDYTAPARRAALVLSGVASKQEHSPGIARMNERPPHGDRPHQSLDL